MKSLVSAISGRADERRLVGARRRNLLLEAAGRDVDDVLRHYAVGRVLAPSDGDQARHGLADGVLAGELARGVALSLEERSQPRLDALDVLVPERLREDRVHAIEQIVDVVPARCGVGEVEVPVRIGRADDPVAVPRNHEEHALLGAQD